MIDTYFNNENALLIWKINSYLDIHVMYVSAERNFYAKNLFNFSIYLIILKAFNVIFLLDIFFFEMTSYETFIINGRNNERILNIRSKILKLL